MEEERLIMCSANFRLAAWILIAAMTRCAGAAGTFSVTNTNDAGAGSLRQAITDANAAAGGTINVNAPGLIILSSPLPIISSSVTVNGGGALVSGNNLFRVFFVDAPPATAVNFNDLVVLNGRAKGGDGGRGGAGG